MSAHPTPSELTEEPTRSLDAMTYSPGVIGWWGLRHRDGWWVGSSAGANTYDDIYLARVALTILWQRDGGKSINYKIERFAGANIITGDFTPQKSAEDAIKDYEENAEVRRADGGSESSPTSDSPKGSKQSEKL